MSGTIDDLMQSSPESNRQLEWIPSYQITKIESTPTNAIYYAGRKQFYYDEMPITLVFLGSSEDCTPTLVSEFARIYSLPTYKYNNDVGQFKRYFTLLSCR